MLEGSEAGAKYNESAWRGASAKEGSFLLAFSV
jgi:hypothetical protein